MVKTEKAGKNRDFSLDMIRLPAMLLVLFFHLNLTYQEAGSASWLVLYAGRNVTLGVLGTILFIQLSGYTSVLSFEKSAEQPLEGILPYYGRRFLSIFPAYWFAYLIFFLYQRLPVRGYDWSIVYTALGLDGYLAMRGVHTCYLVGEWYVGCILILYLVFPLIFICSRKKPVMMISAAAVLKAVSFLLIRKGILPEAEVLFFAPEFIAGVLFGMYHREVPHWEGLTSAAVLLLAMLIPVPEGFKLLMITPAGISAFILLKYLGQLLAKPQGRAVSALRNAITVSAKYSFAAFLVHHQVLLLVFQGTAFIGGAKRYPVYVIGTFIFTALLSIGVYGASEHITGLIRRKK